MKVIEIPFSPDTNIKEALEKAFIQEQSFNRKFDFAIQYFGYFGQEYGGYQVIMIDRLYDNPKNPFDYWKLLVNGSLAHVGIENYMINSGDIIEFDYSVYIPEKDAVTILGKKHDYYSALDINI